MDKDHYEAYRVPYSMNETTVLLARLSTFQCHCPELTPKLEALARKITGQTDANEEELMQATLLSALKREGRHGCSRTQLYTAIRWECEVSISSRKLDALLRPLLESKQVQWKQTGRYFTHPCIRYWLRPHG